MFSKRQKALSNPRMPFLAKHKSTILSTFSSLDKSFARVRRKYLKSLCLRSLRNRGSVSLMTPGHIAIRLCQSVLPLRWGPTMNIGFFICSLDQRNSPLKPVPGRRGLADPPPFLSDHSPYSFRTMHTNSPPTPSAELTAAPTLEKRELKAYLPKISVSIFRVKKHLTPL